MSDRKPLTLAHTETARGFALIKFADLYRQECSIQKSSLATEDCIWFGVDVDLEGKTTNHRMHLSQEDVKTLLPVLEKFVKTGEL
jgi:hypothetical protein